MKTRVSGEGTARLTPGSPAPVLGTHNGRCARRGPPPPGAPGCLSSRWTSLGSLPPPKFQAEAGYLPRPVSSPSPIPHPWDSGLPGRGTKREQRGLCSLAPGGWELCSLTLPRAPRSAGVSAPPSTEGGAPRPQRLRSGRGAPGHRGLFPGGRGGGRGTRGDAWRALLPAEGRWRGGGGKGRISAAGGGGGGGRGSLRRAEPGGAGRASRALSGLLLPEQRRLELAPSLLQSSSLP